MSTIRQPAAEFLMNNRQTLLAYYITTTSFPKLRREAKLLLCRTDCRVCCILCSRRDRQTNNSCFVASSREVKSFLPKTTIALPWLVPLWEKVFSARLSRFDAITSSRLTHFSPFTTFFPKSSRICITFDSF
jgi:hypothetical protein